MTATRVVTGSGSQYRKEDGRLIGADAWHPVTVSPATGDDIARVRAENRQRRAFNALRGLFNSREAREHIERLPIERLEHALELLAPPRTTACRHCAKPIEWRQIATTGDGKPVEKWVAVGERRHHPQQGSTYVCQYDDERRHIISYHEPEEATP